MSGSPAFWTEERVETVKTLWADGLTASQIGDRLGCTRNSVIGKVSRLKLPGRVVVRGSLAYASTRNKAGKSQIRKSYGSTSFLSPLQLALQKIRADAEPVPAPSVPDVARVSFDDLEDKQCKYIPSHIDPKKTKTNEPQYCGEPKVIGLSYCAAHAQRCYAPPRPVSPGTDRIPIRFRVREFA